MRFTFDRGASTLIEHPVGIAASAILAKSRPPVFVQATVAPRQTGVLGKNHDLEWVSGRVGTLASPQAHFGLSVKEGRL